MAQGSEQTRFYRALVAIETDATRYYGANASRPALLNAGDSEQMLAHIAADLKSLLPEISHCSLITAGALFDQTQVLRPSFPVFSALENVPSGDGKAPFSPRLVSIGAENGVMPVGELQPLPDIPLGLLQLLPVVVHGPASLVSELGQAMEYRFLEEGQVSAHSANWLESAFGISINHARLMTLTDLNAMLRMQLDHFGFLPLWELIDAALCGRSEPLSVSTAAGREFELKDGVVRTAFETFDAWASDGGGAGLPASRQALATGYVDWTRETRQYLTTLNAHGLKLRFHLPGEAKPLEGTFVRESSETAPRPGNSAITEHSYGELGTIAITVSQDNGTENYYPLCPQGLNDIHASLGKQLPGGQTVAFPGCIHYDENTRKLIPDGGQPARH